MQLRYCRRQLQLEKHQYFIPTAVTRHMMRR
ncbi:hypothetical protein CUMW_278330 [Citrus unshiu]|uniref:Uncharacterized protein n=1 Tax=Citrus unshiu TaxID=55188 RepID=A0A2H5N5W8_CITUN|nr:hypothetical protein CUMW_278330 [Citrus unshiu]